MYDSCRRTSRHLTAIAILAALLLAACGHASVDLDAKGSQRSSSKQQQTDRAWLDARWQQVLANPGKPGVDYSTRRITVSYQPGASLSRGIAVTVPPAGQRAADQGNAVLRQHRQFEALTDAIAGRYGLRITNQVYMGNTNAAGFELPAGNDGKVILAGIRRDFAGAIQWATYARLAHPCYDTNDPWYTGSSTTAGPVWGLRKIGCPRAWDFGLGSTDIVLGVMDSGARMTHEDLVNVIVDPSVTYPEVNCDVVNQDDIIEDLEGHGSGCTGIVACEADNNLTLVGGAPGCSVLPLKITNDWADATDMTVSEAGYLGQNLGLRAISMSFGWFEPVPVIETMCNDVTDAGLLLIASAGNEDADFERWPAAYPVCLSIGATNINDERISHAGWWGSNYGAGVDIAAPGEDYASCSNQADTGDTAYQLFGGTSGSAPHVLAAAGLVWSSFPGWTAAQVRDALLQTAAPCTGFAAGVGRVDVGALFDTYGTGMHLDPPARLLEHGSATIAPTVNGRFNTISALLNDAPAGTVDGVPWSFDLDISGLGFEPFNVKLHGETDTDQYDAEATYWADNSAPAFPFKESFDSTSSRMRDIDLRSFNVNLINQLYLTTATNLTNIVNNGQGSWQASAAAPYSGSGCYYCGLPAGNDYGSFELDCLVTQALDLSQTANPTLVYYQHYNVEDGGQAYDRCQVLVSSDYGAHWALATLNGGGNATFTGYQQDWQRVEIDLSPYVGQTVHIAFVFNSDENLSGENTAADKGWWVDDMTVSKLYKDQLASFTLNPSLKLLGQIPGQFQLDLGVANPDSVGRIDYQLDLLPLGNDGPEDINASSSLTPFSSSLFLSAGNAPNQIAVLRARSFDTEGSEGIEQTQSVYIFNHLGDVNADGAVDQIDADAYNGMVGFAQGQAQYVPFFDSDMDGFISEADASAVGYFWTAGN